MKVYYYCHSEGIALAGVDEVTEPHYFHHLRQMGWRVTGTDKDIGDNRTIEFESDTFRMKISFPRPGTIMDWNVGVQIAGAM